MCRERIDFISPFGLTRMARIDSLILVMLGIAQIMIGDVMALEFLGILLQGTGGGTIVMAIYFLIFLSDSC